MREIQYSTISEDDILNSYDIYHKQENSNKPKISKASQTLQIYSANQLKKMLDKNGFKVLHQCSFNGRRLIEAKTERIVTFAKKK